MPKSLIVFALAFIVVTATMGQTHTKLGPKTLSPCLASQLSIAKNKHLRAAEDMGFQSSYPSCNPAFLVAYRAFIPLDHVTTPGDGCTFFDSAGYHAVDYMYIGDFDPSYASYRVNQSATVLPESGQYSGPWSAAGQTEQFGYGTPINPPYISSPDFDGTWYDCHYFNQSATASPAGWSNYNGGVPAAHEVNAVFSGASVNPVSYPFISAGPIRWSITTTVDTSNYYSPWAASAYTISCFPYHQVTVNGRLILDAPPPYGTSFAAIASCLEFSYLDVTSNTGGWSVPLL